VDFRKSLFILPNLFTLACVFSGFVSLTLSASGDTADNLYLSALAICFGAFFDTIDGRVARLTKTQTDLGRDLDSLADVMTFGAAPALLIYKWGLTDFRRLGVFIAGLYVCAGALRLARFNVLSRRDELAGAKRPGKYSVGLSIPVAASVVVLMVIVSHHAGEFPLLSAGGTAAVVLVLSLLMVSRVRFRSFKDLRANKRTLGVVLLLVGAGVAIARAGLEKSFIFLFLVVAYIALGLAEEVIFFRSRRAEARAGAAATPSPTSPPPGKEEDAAVLRELGAFDEGEEEARKAGASTATQATKPAG
jgi:CDP-diacylglycerol--serine O-phosphatidyltransferase